MDKSCLGCRVFFSENEKINFNENLLIQFKDYRLPIQRDEIKFTLLKEIVSFLNCKGGTIYIGVEDKQGLVKGIQLGHKQMDEFQLFMRGLLKTIYPKVDLGNKQEVIVHFVPILKDGKFRGKYVIKLIVKQGDPSRIYCMNEKGYMKNQVGGSNEGSIHFAFLRENIGATQRIYGNQLLQLIYQRCKKPIPIYKTHENCNPQPRLGQYQIQNICIQNVDKQLSRNLKLQMEMMFPKMLRSNDIEYHEDRKKIIIRCSDLDEQQFKQITQFFNSNLKKLNQLLHCNLIVKGDFKSSYIIQNIRQEVMEKKEGKSDQKNLIIAFINTKEIDSLKKKVNLILGAKMAEYQGYKCGLFCISFAQNENVYNLLNTLKKQQKQFKSCFFNEYPIYGISNGKIAILNYLKGQSKNFRSYLFKTMPHKFNSIDINEDKEQSLVCQVSNLTEFCATYQLLYENKQMHSKFGVNKNFVKINVNFRAKN